MTRKAAIITTVIRFRIATRGHAGCGGRKARVSRRYIPFKRFTATAGQFRRDLHKYPARASHRNKDHHDKARLHLCTERSLAYGHKHLRHFDNIHIYKLMAHIALVIALVLKRATEPPLRSQRMFSSFCWPLLSGIEPIHQNLFNERRQRPHFLLCGFLDCGLYGGFHSGAQWKFCHVYFPAMSTIRLHHVYIL